MFHYLWGEKSQDNVHEGTFEEKGVEMENWNHVIRLPTQAAVGLAPGQQ